MGALLCVDVGTVGPRGRAPGCGRRDLRGEPPERQVLEVVDEGLRVRHGERDASLRRGPPPGRLRGEEEDEAPHESEVQQEGIDPAEEPLAHAAPGEAPGDADDLDEVGHHRRLEALGQDLPQEEGGEAGLLARHLPEGVEEGPQGGPRGGRPLLDGLQPGDHRGEPGLEDGDVEAALAPEVVADEGLVDPGPRRHLLGRDPVEPPLGEEEGAGPQQGLPRGLGVPPLPFPVVRGRLPSHLDHPIGLIN